MAELHSESILVFPSTRRGNYQASARYHQESTYTNYIDNICNYNKGSFIITLPQSNFDTGQMFFDTKSQFDFCIYGYRFSISSLDTLFSTLSSNIFLDEKFSEATKIYAYIDVDRILVDPVTNEYKEELRGIDDIINKDTTGKTYYSGVKFSSSDPGQSQSRYSLLLFDRKSKDNDWNYGIVKQSLYRFNSLSYESDVDGGIIQ